MQAPHPAAWALGAALVLSSLLFASFGPGLGAALPSLVGLAGAGILVGTFVRARRPAGTLLLERDVTPGNEQGHTAAANPSDRAIVAALHPRNSPGPSPAPVPASVSATSRAAISFEYAPVPPAPAGFDAFQVPGLDQVPTYRASIDGAAPSPRPNVDALVDEALQTFTPPGKASRRHVARPATARRPSRKGGQRSRLASSHGAHGRPARRPKRARVATSQGDRHGLGSRPRRRAAVAVTGSRATSAGTSRTR